MPFVFEWDSRKAAANLAKHRPSFDVAIEVFADPAVAVVASIRERDKGKRFKALGRIGDRIVTVVYAERGEVKRIISARRANATEERRYVDGSPDD